MQLPAAIAAVLICFALYDPFSPAARQKANMQRAETQLPVIRRHLETDKRFANLQLAVTTARDGAIVVIANVSSETDLADLRSLVASTSPPVDVVWHVLAIPPEPSTQQSLDDGAVRGQ